MTQMQSPYHESDVKLYQEPERTSLMAILSLVFGIGGCCLAITSIPAILLGVFGLVGISRNKGRVGGTGFGIAGILIGLLTLALWGGFLGVVVFGMNQHIASVGQPTEQALLDFQAKDYDGIRTIMDAPGADASDEQCLAFYEAYSGAVGEYVSLPDGPWDLIQGYAAVAQSMQPYQGRFDMKAMPMRFDSGWVLVVYMVDVDQIWQGDPRAMEYIIVDSQGNEYHFPGDADSDGAVVEDAEDGSPAPSDDGP